MNDKITGEVNQSTAAQLKQYIEGIENYEAEKKVVAERLKEVYDEARAAGFDVKIMRQIVRLRKMDKTKLEEQEYLLETYKEALGMA
jgi:uncharacterized protein (UPF0335 family)